MRVSSPTAFVFAAGGSLGAVEVGMLKSLGAAGVTPDFVVGSSVGGINAAYFAHDPTVVGITRLEQVWRGVRTPDVFPVSPLRGITRLLAGRDHLVSPAALQRLLDQNLPLTRLEDGRIPCHLVTTGVAEGRAVVLSSGPAVEALLATTAIPGVFPPVRWGAETLMDGAVASGTPVAAALALGAERVVVLSPGLPCALERPPHGVVAMGLHALNLLIVHQLVADLERLAGAAEIIVAPPLCPLAVSSYDFSQTGTLIDRAAAATAQWLRDGGLSQRAIPRALRPHAHRSGHG